MFCNNSGSYYRYKRVFAMSKLIDKKSERKIALYFKVWSWVKLSITTH